MMNKWKEERRPCMHSGYFNKPMSVSQLTRGLPLLMLFLHQFVTHQPADQRYCQHLIVRATTKQSLQKDSPNRQIVNVDVEGCLLLLCTVAAGHYQIAGCFQIHMCTFESIIILYNIP